MINKQAEQEAFEKQMKKSGCPDIHLKKKRDGSYWRQTIDMAFQGWIMKAGSTEGNQQ